MLVEECKLLGPLLGGKGKRGEASRNILAKIVRAMATGEIRQFLEDGGPSAEDRAEGLGGRSAELAQLREDKARMLSDLQRLYQALKDAGVEPPIADPAVTYASVPAPVVPTTAIPSITFPGVNVADVSALTGIQGIVSGAPATAAAGANVPSIGVPGVPGIGTVAGAAGASSAAPEGGALPGAGGAAGAP